MEGEFESEGSVGRVRRTGDSSSPVEQIFGRRGKCRNTRSTGKHQLHQLRLKARNMSVLSCRIRSRL